MPLRRFVVVSGLPASGKSTLARAVAPLLGLPLIDKDDILEQLFEARGTGDMAWRRQLSRESDALFQAEATASAGAVLTSFWHVPGMAATSGTSVDWVLALSPLVVALHCACPPSVAAERFLSRTRHQGHLDATRDPNEIRTTFEALATLGSAAVPDIVHVDTTQPASPVAVAAEIEAAFARWAERQIAG